MRPGLRVKLMGVLCVTVLLAAAPASSPVADAAMRGDTDAVRALLQQGADVNAAHGDGMSALHWAADRGDTEMAEMLVYAGANVDAVTRIGHYTPLHLAAKVGSASMVELLLKAGGDVTARTTNSGATPLHLAAASGDVDAVTVLLDHGADMYEREAEYGQTPLIFAAAQNRADVIRVLLERGAEPSMTTKVVDVQLESALGAAANDRQRQVLEAFLVTGQAPTPRQVQAAVRAGRELYLSGVVPEKKEEEEAEDAGSRRAPAFDRRGGMTALLHAARQGHVEAALALLEGGADVNQVSEADATSPLVMAVINGQFDLALLLLEHGADPNLAADFNGATPLWAAINAQWQPRTRFPQPQEQGLQKASYLDVMEALLETGADPDARLTKHPWYMVYTGCGNGNCGLVNTDGSTAFWRAAYATDLEAMRLLVAYGADPNIPTKAPPPRRRRQQGGDPGRANVPDPARNDWLEFSGKDRPELAGAAPAPARASRTDQSGSAGTDRYDPTRADETGAGRTDPSGLPPVPPGGPGVWPVHAASGVGYGEGFAGNAHRHAPDGWLPVVKYLVEELGVDVNARDHSGYTALHHAAARGDNEMILYLVKKGADVTVVSRRGQSVADMANGPVQRVSPFPATVALLELLGSKNNHNCVTC